MLRTVVSGTLLATTALLGAVDSSTAWPQFADLRAADHNLIVPVQMRGGGMGGGGMAGGGMAGGGMAGGGMAGWRHGRWRHGWWRHGWWGVAGAGAKALRQGGYGRRGRQGRHGRRGR